MWEVGVHLSNGYYAGTHGRLVNLDNDPNNTVSFNLMSPIRAVGAVTTIDHYSTKAIELLEYYDADGNIRD